MVLTWRQRRKYLYLSVVSIFAAFVLFFLWETFLHTTPTCTDGAQNAGEVGVDCGGPCALVCQNTARPPTVLWARSFAVGTGMYTAAAYIQNNMVGFGARQVAYSFQVFDAQNILITERTGVADLPPNQTIPIIEPNIPVGDRVVAYTQFTFARNPVWSKVPPESVTPLRVSSQVLAADGTRLSTTIHNDSVRDVSRVIVVAVLFDTEGIARAASKSLVQSLGHKSSQGLVFTWPTPVANVARAEITILPEF